MYIKILLNYLFGHINIFIEGFFIERFINLCKSKKIFLWNTKIEKSTILTASMGIKDFKEIVKIAKKTKCRVKIKSKKGLPFIIYRYKKRKIFAFGFVFLISSIIYLSNFIWNIEIVGLNQIEYSEIIDVLKSEGIYLGKYKRNINLVETINSVRYKRDDIAWLGIELEGTNLIVKVVEADKKPEIVNENEFCNIISNKDAIIVKVNAVNGTPNVNEGDVVKKGDVLINGWIEGQYTGVRLVHAEGSITAKVWYSEKEKIYYKQEYKEETGKEENKYSLKFNKFKINFYKKLSKFEKYDTIKTVNKIKIFANLYLPIEIEKQNNIELEIKEKMYTFEEAKALGISILEEKFNNQINNQNNITNKYINIYEAQEYVEIEIIYEVLENIEIDQKIEG